MNNSLKEKTLRGLSWSFIDNFIGQFISFVVGVVLARLIAPTEFGVIAYIIFFVAILTTFVDCGFTTALVRKNNCTSTDYSTVFYFNLTIGVLLYLLLVFLAPLAESFFEVPGFALILQVGGLSLIINALGSIQLTILTKRIDFKTKAKITISSNILAGIIAIVLAYKGFGVWSLVWRTLLGHFFTSALLWVLNDWRPSMVFSVKSFRELFGFGYKMALSGLIDTISNNIFYPIIGKNFSPATLGQYTRASQFSNLFSSTLTSNIQRVTFPVLSSLQDDPEKLKSGYRKMIKGTMLVTFACMLGLAAVAKPMILILIGEKWLPCVPYLQLMCLSSMLYPLHAMNLNVIMVKGRSDLFLKLEIIKKVLLIPLIFTGIYWGVIALLIGDIILSLIAYLLNSYYSANLISYPTKEQIMDILPFLLVSICVSGLVWCITFLEWNSWCTVILQVGAGIGLTMWIYEMMKQPDYREVKQIALQFLGKMPGGKIITTPFNHLTR